MSTREYVPIVQGLVWDAEHGTDYAVERLDLLVDRWGDKLGTNRRSEDHWFLFDDRAQFKSVAAKWAGHAIEPRPTGDLAKMLAEFWGIGWDNGDPLKWLAKICGMEAELNEREAA